MIFANDIISSTGGNYFLTINEVFDYIRPVNDSPNESLSSFVESAIGYVTDEIEYYCEHGIKAQDYVGYYDGNNLDKLYTDNFPINSVSSIQYRVTPLDSYSQSLVLNTQDYVFDYKTYVQLYTNIFPAGNKSIKIVYNAGYTEIPKQIKRVAIEMIQILYDTSQFGKSLLGYKSQNDNAGGFGSSKTIDYMPIKNEHKRILDRFKKVEIC